MALNKWVDGVITLIIGDITPLITGRGPPCTLPLEYIYIYMYIPGSSRCAKYVPFLQKNYQKADILRIVSLRIQVCPKKGIYLSILLRIGGIFQSNDFPSNRNEL